MGFLKNSLESRENSNNDEKDTHTLISTVEPFLDMELQSLRASLIDDNILHQTRIKIIKDLGDDINNPEFLSRLINVLAEIKAENYYLKAAYIESCRYKESSFEIKIPKLPEKIKPDVLEIDMRAEITGVNWYYAEHDGRWAGPENSSSIHIPALNFGDYEMKIEVVGEIVKGIIDNMEITFNNQIVKLHRDKNVIPCLLIATVTVNESWKFPFWSLKFKFLQLASPSDFGSPDKRRLAIRVKTIIFSRIKE